MGRTRSGARRARSFARAYGGADGRAADRFACRSGQHRPTDRYRHGHRTTTSCLFTTGVDEARSLAEALRIPSAVARRRAGADSFPLARRRPGHRAGVFRPTRRGSRSRATTRLRATHSSMVQELDRGRAARRFVSAAGSAAGGRALARMVPEQKSPALRQRQPHPRMNCGAETAHRARGGRQARAVSIT